MKNSNDTIGHRSRNIPVCSAVPQPLRHRVPLRILKLHVNWTRITGTFHEDQYTFLIISRSFLLRMRNVSDKSCREIKTHILCSIHFFNLAVCEILWKNVIEPGRMHITMWLMRIPSWLSNATNTHSE
jgi:hypothetical protein